MAEALAEALDDELAFQTLGIWDLAPLFAYARQVFVTESEVVFAQLLQMENSETTYIEPAAHDLSTVERRYATAERQVEPKPSSFVMVGLGLIGIGYTKRARLPS